MSSVIEPVGIRQEKEYWVVIMSDETEVMVDNRFGSIEIPVCIRSEGNFFEGPYRGSFRKYTVHKTDKFNKVRQKKKPEIQKDVVKRKVNNCISELEVD